MTHSGGRFLRLFLLFGCLVLVGCGSSDTTEKDRLDEVSAKRTALGHQIAAQNNAVEGCQERFAKPGVLGIAIQRELMPPDHRPVMLYVSLANVVLNGEGNPTAVFRIDRIYGAVPTDILLTLDTSPDQASFLEDAAKEVRGYEDTTDLAIVAAVESVECKDRVDTELFDAESGVYVKGRLVAGVVIPALAKPKTEGAK